MQAKRSKQRKRFITYLTLGAFVIMNVLVPKAVVAHTHDLNNGVDTTVIVSDVAASSGLAAQFGEKHQAHKNGSASDWSLSVNINLHPAFHVHDTLNDTFSFVRVVRRLFVNFDNSMTLPGGITIAISRLEFEIYHPPKS